MRFIAVLCCFALPHLRRAIQIKNFGTLQPFVYISTSNIQKYKPKS